MLRVTFVILAVIMAQNRISALITPDLCERIEFDFRHPRQALAALKACIDLDENRITSLQQRFLTSWAKYAVVAGVGQAVRALADPEVREALLPEEDWLAVITKPAAAIRKSLMTSDPSQPTFIMEIVLVTVLTVLTAGVAAWTLKLKSAVLRELPKAKAGLHRKERPMVWEPERERLLQDCEPDH